jgi:fructose/tagatose bisphosphate aldolase
MSANIIEAAVVFSESKGWPICLIASRRQIESKKLGGGYVDNLTTEVFAKNLSEAVASDNVILARDHGGPYQRSDESGLSFDEAMDNVESSYRTDIESGFNIIHIDPEKCIEPGDVDGLAKFTDLTKQLLGRCFAILDDTGRDDVRFEVGTDEGIGMDFAPEQWAEFLGEIKEFCVKKNMPSPIAIAIPLGTKVKEAENIGGLALNTEDPFWLKRVDAMHEVAGRFGVKLKLHNADYITDDVLKKYLELGVEQINVAPQLGVVETQALLKLLRENNMVEYADRFLKIAYDSRKWERWLKADTSATNEDKAVISGHYIFSSPEGQLLLEEIESQLGKDKLKSFLLNAITECIENYYSIMEETYAAAKRINS